MGVSDAYLREYWSAQFLKMFLIRLQIHIVLYIKVSYKSAWQGNFHKYYITSFDKEKHKIIYAQMTDFIIRYIYFYILTQAVCRLLDKINVNLYFTWSDFLSLQGCHLSGKDRKYNRKNSKNYIICSTKFNILRGLRT